MELTIKELQWAEQNLGIKAKGLNMSQAARVWLSGGEAAKGDKPTKAYAQVDVVFACVEKLIAGVQGMPLIISNLNEEIVESGAAYDLLYNGVLNFEQFIMQTVGHYALTRDVFWIFDNIINPKELTVVNGSQMRAITSDGTARGELIGWEFNGSSGQRVKLGLSEVYQIKNFNPYDQYHGLGPLAAAGLAISQSYQASLFNEASLANGAEPGAILTSEQTIDPEQIQMLREQFDSRHRGASKAKKTALLTGGMDIKTIALDMVDMQVTELRELNDKRICSAFGVPPAVVGLVTEAQYSAGPAQRDFIFNTIIPLCAMLAGHITNGILKKFYASRQLAVSAQRAKNLFGSKKLAVRAAYRQAKIKAINTSAPLFAWFDNSVHPVVQESQREITDKVLNFRNAGVPLNNLIEAHDLPYELQDWGNDWWIPMGQVPARWTLEGGMESLVSPSLPEGGDSDKKEIELISDKKIDDPAKLRIWRNWVGSWAGIEKEYSQAVRVLFVRQEKELVGKLKKAFEELKANTKAGEDIVARVVFDLEKEDGKFRAINQTFFDKAASVGIRQAASEVLGLAGAELDKFAETVLREPAIKRALLLSARNLKDANKLTQERIARSLREGLKKEEGLNDLVKRVQKELSTNRQRSLMIARTQTAGGVGAGRHSGYTAAGVELKGWLTSGDENVRDIHIAAGKAYAAGIPVNEPFWVGGDALMHPGDPGASPANIINCRCVEIAVKAGKKNFGLDYYDKVKFYSYEDLNGNQD